MQFNEMNLGTTILSAVDQSGYTEPTPIQEATIKLVLDGKDVMGCAQTGTGKTAAFALPILRKISEKTDTTDRKKFRPIKALILTPTRELAMQILESFEQYGKGLFLRYAVVFGGVPQNPQVEKLRRGVDILVATPGRLNDLIGQGYIDLKSLDIFVLDEADRMLDMGFINDVKKVITHLPEQRQTLMFSATMPIEVEGLALNILNNPESVKVDPPTSTVDSINQTVYYIDRCNKLKLLLKLIEDNNMTSVLVFTRTKHWADRVVRELIKNNVNSMAIHGNKSQNARQTALKLFKAGKIKVLVATDIAARGIDIAQLPYVINYDIPEDAETYIHRIGRTGRAGMDGSAISFCCFDELDLMQSVEKLIGKTVVSTPSPWPLEVTTSELPPLRFSNQKRGSGNASHSSQNRSSGKGGYGKKPSNSKPGNFPRRSKTQK